MTKEPQIPPQRLFFYRLFAIIFIPLLILVLFEGGLRLIRFGYNPSFTVKNPKKEGQHYWPNHRFSESFLSPGVVRWVRPFSATRKKPPQTLRIFVLGGSAAAGFPQSSKPFAFSRILEVILQDQFPDTKIEVFNAAGDSYNSHAYYFAMKDLQRFESDFYILYMGHNEVIGPFGPGTVFTPFQSHLGMIRGLALLKTSRIGQLLTALLPKSQMGQNFEQSQEGFDELLQITSGLLAEKQFLNDEPQILKTYQHLERNLEDIVKMILRSKAKVLICTVGSRLRDWAPFGSLHHDPVGDNWHIEYQKGIELELTQEYEQAIKQYQRAAAIDDHYADLHFRLGRCYLALNQPKQAKKHFTRARDLDTMRFRGDTEVNNVIRRVAEKNASDDIVFLDTESVLNQKSPSGIAGKEFFYEYAHLNFTGNYLLAKTIFETLQPRLPEWLKDKHPAKPILSENESAKRLAFTDFNRYETAFELFDWFQRPPITYMLNHGEIMTDLREKLNAANDYMMSDRPLESVEVYKRALENDPDDPWIHYNFARLLMNMNRLQEAAEHLDFVVQKMPEYVLLKHMLEQLQAVL